MILIMTIRLMINCQWQERNWQPIAMKTTWVSEVFIVDQYTWKDQNRWVIDGDRQSIKSENIAFPLELCTDVSVKSIEQVNVGQISL